jgi:uncharacterized protein YqhQ
MCRIDLDGVIFGFCEGGRKEYRTEVRSTRGSIEVNAFIIGKRKYVTVATLQKRKGCGDGGGDGNAGE